MRRHSSMSLVISSSSSDRLNRKIYAHGCKMPLLSPGRGRSVLRNRMSRSSGRERLFPMKKTTDHLIAEVPCRRSRIGMTIGIDLGDVWSHYCTLNEDGEVVDRGRFRTTPKAIDKWFTDVPHARVAMEAGTHSI